jgi:hypothetical protein
LETRTTLSRSQSFSGVSAAVTFVLESFHAGNSLSKGKKKHANVIANFQSHFFETNRETQPMI